MTVADLTTFPASIEEMVPHRFVFAHVDWAFYQSVGEKLANRRVFITYYKGKLELVTVSLLHERISSLLVILIRVIAEEMSMPIQGAGMSTLQRMDLDEGVEPDSSFYTTHELQMRGKQEIDLSLDPPPDLAVEVEVTRRLGVRKSIYRELGVPEIWVYSQAGLSILVRSEDSYLPVERSPTFPIMLPGEITSIIKAGLVQDETAFTKAFRRRVQEILSQH